MRTEYIGGLGVPNASEGGLYHMSHNGTRFITQLWPIPPRDHFVIRIEEVAGEGPRALHEELWHGTLDEGVTRAERVIEEHTKTETS